jgi:hypothetical protein
VIALDCENTVACGITSASLRWRPGGTIVPRVGTSTDTGTSISPIHSCDVNSDTAASAAATVVMRQLRHVIRAVFEPKIGSWTAAAAVPQQIRCNHVEAPTRRGERTCPVEVGGHADAV